MRHSWREISTSAGSTHPKDLKRSSMVQGSSQYRKSSDRTPTPWGWGRGSKINKTYSVLICHDILTTKFILDNLATFWERKFVMTIGQRIFVLKMSPDCQEWLTCIVGVEREQLNRFHLTRPNHRALALQNSTLVFCKEPATQVLRRVGLTVQCSVPMLMSFT